MGKTLLNKIGNAVKRSALIGLASLSFAACQPNINPIPDKTDSAPTVTMSSPNLTMKVGESVPIKFVWEDKDGNGDITNYNFWLDKNGNNNMDAGEELLTQSTPFTDYTFTPTSAGNFKFMAEDIDKEGLTGKANLEITVSDNVTPPIEPPINPPVNNAPTITSIPITPVNENGPYSYQVTVNNPEGDKLTYSLPTKLVWLSIDANTGLISGKITTISEDTIYPVEIDVSDGTNTTKQNFNLIVKNLLDITGNIESNEDYPNYSAKPGEVKIYNYDDVATYDSLNNFIGYNFTSKTPLIDQDVSSGNFSQIQLPKVVSKAVLRAKLNPDSYIRTITLDGTKDYTSQNNNSLTDKIRVVPYPTLYSKENFKEFMREINISQTPDEYGKEFGLRRWNLDNLVGIEILKYNPWTNNSNDVFTDPQQQAIADKIKNSSDIPLFINSKKNLGSIIQPDTKDNQDSNNHYDSSGNPNSGWIIVVPENNLTDMYNNTIAGKTSDYSTDYLRDGIIKRSKIEIRPEHAGDAKMSHEFGHAFIAPNGEASNPLFSKYTIMDPNGTIPLPADADIKAGKIIYEDTYLPREKLDDILGLNWMN